MGSRFFHCGGRGYERDLVFWAGGICGADCWNLCLNLRAKPRLPNEEFERERAQKVEELTIARTTPGFLAGERLRKSFFGAHPYANFEPSVEQVKAYMRDSLVNYYRERYRPNGALFVAVGDFEPAKMMAQIERAFANWAGDALSKTPRPELPKYRGRRVMLVHVPGSVQTQVLRGNLAITQKASGLAAAGAGEQYLRRRISFAAGDEYSRAKGIHV